MTDNPYAAPKTRVEDAPTALPDGDFIPAGRGVPTGNGWRWLADAWSFTGLQRGTFIGVTLLLAVLWIVVSLVPLGGPLALSLFYPAISAGLMLGCDAVRRGERLEVGHLFAGFKHQVGRLIGVGAISVGLGVVFFLIMFSMVGATLGMAMLTGATPSPEEVGPMLVTMLLAILVVMAISIPCAMAMWFVVPLIVFHDFEIVQALKTSFMACLKNILPFLIWGIAVLVFSVLATIPLFLGWLLLGPMLWASAYLIYRDVFHDV